MFNTNILDAMSEKVSVLFNAALELEPPQREQYLSRQCENDLILRKEVESLLRVSRESDIFFNHFFSKTSTKNLCPDFSDSNNQFSIGLWRLVRKLGYGGMGCVYLAENRHCQLENKAAIKILPPGEDDPVARYRFNSECKILSSLKHKNIAQFIDGGATTKGQPYLVMEYIDGRTIDSFIKSKKLDIAEKLQLVLDICNAVQYAHCQQVIHRDLKPANVLVDNSHTVKLIDFGVAKSFAKKQEEMDFTRVSRCPLTLEYASPELLRGEPTGISTDIYSLGVMLYELLCAEKPFQFNNIGDYYKAERYLPAKPSIKSHCKQQQKQLKGNLDRIILKAMHPELSMRYKTVEGLACDIKNHIAGLPVNARVYNTTYPVRRFLVHNIKSAIITVIVMLSLGLNVYLIYTVLPACIAENVAPFFYTLFKLLPIHF